MNPSTFDQVEAEESRRHHRAMNITPKDHAIQRAIAKRDAKAKLTAPVPTPILTTPATTSDEESHVDQYPEVHFDFYRIPHSPAMHTVIDYYFSKWKNYEEGQRRRALKADSIPAYRLMLGVLLANLQHAKIMGHQGGVYTSRSRAILGRSEPRYWPVEFNERFITLLDGLTDMNVILQQVGNWQGDRTIINGTRHLWDTMRRQRCLHEHDTTANRVRQEVCLLKSAKGWDADSPIDPNELLEYEDTALTIRYRQEVRSINAYLEGDAIQLTPEGRFIDQRDCFIQRQFINGRFDHGGRLKNGYWNNGAMRSAEHFARIRPKGERPVKLDYRSMQMHLLYTTAGLHAPTSKFAGGDLYAIPGLDPASRPGIKKIIAASTFHSRTLTRFPQGAEKLLSPRDQGLGFKFVWSKIVEAHAPIAHLLGNGIGYGLQFQESSLMVSLLLEMKKLNYPSLPIHDCLLVARSDAFEVQTVMENVSEAFTKSGIIPVGREERA